MHNKKVLHLQIDKGMIKNKSKMMKKGKFSLYAVLFATAVIFFSCRAGKEYHRPELELPKQFQATSFADTSSIADIEWKTFFTDTLLQRLIQQGLTYNHDLLIAIKRIDIAKQQ